MENRSILVDTSILIAFLRKERKDDTVLWRLREQFSCAMSSVTLFELWAGAANATKRSDVAKLTKWIDVLMFDQVTADIAGEIFRLLKAENKLIEFRDIFIAATAKQYKLELATLNTGHFERIQDLELLALQ